jgi:hypothetical protein
MASHGPSCDPLRRRLARLTPPPLDRAEARILEKLAMPLPPQRRPALAWVDAILVRRPLPRLATLGAAALTGLAIGLWDGPSAMHNATVDLSARVFDVTPQGGWE